MPHARPLLAFFSFFASASIASAFLPSCHAAPSAAGDVGASASDLEEIPNDLRSLFKSAGKLDDVEIDVGSARCRARLEPRFHSPALVYGAPQGRDQLAQDLVQSRLSPRYSLALRSDDGAVADYDLFYEGVRIEQATLRIRDQGEHRAAAVVFPVQNVDPVRFERTAGAAPAHGLALVADVLTEYRREVLSPNAVRLTYPAATRVPAKIVKTLVAKEDLAGTLEKVRLPRGTFPDQIRAASNGDLWFSQPSDNLVTRYRPSDGTWFHQSVGPAPDGLWIDRKGGVWFGEYNGNALGHYVSADGAEGHYERFVLPASTGARNPAIPFEDSEGLLWVADHAANRIHRFDPKTQSFEAFPVPTTGSWPVDITQGDDPNLVFVAETYAHQIGVIHKDTGEFTEIPLASQALTAFFVVRGQTMFLTGWSWPGFLRYDLSSGELIEYLFDTTAMLGPIAALPSGKVAMGSIANGRVYLFDEASDSLLYVTQVGSLKDGMTVRGNEVWATESGPVLDRIRFSQ